jgi:hypothetical protein
MDAEEVVAVDPRSGRMARHLRTMMLVLRRAFAGGPDPAQARGRPANGPTPSRVRVDAAFCARVWRRGSGQTLLLQIPNLAMPSSLPHRSAGFR